MIHDGVEDALRIASDYFGVEVADIRSPRRTRDIHPARVWAAYLAAMTTDAQFATIGQQFGGRDHTIIRMYARACARDVAMSAASARLYAVLAAQRRTG